MAQRETNPPLDHKSTGDRRSLDRPMDRPASRFLAQVARDCEDGRVPDMLPPNQGRLRDARAAGLRPRSSMLSLAAVALLGTGLLAWLGARTPGWLAASLERAFVGVEPPTPDATLCTMLLLGLLGSCALVAVIAAGRRPSPRSLGVSPTLGEIPPWLTLASCIVAIVLLGAWLRPVIAAAARGVDVAGVAGAWLLWSTWLGRGLLGLAVVATVLGVIERLISARSLWQGLHLTRAQASERARASGERRR
jgi:hypothetical protein